MITKGGWGDLIRNCHDNQVSVIDLREHPCWVFALWLEDHFCELAAADLAPYPLVGMG